jgi:preprotein translocase subunit SecD
MRKNLNGKIILIVVVILGFLYGIFGIPRGLSGAALKQALADHIHLGLDLKGGTHLVLQVMVEESVGNVTDNDLQRLQMDLQQGGFAAQSVFKPDPKQPGVIQVQGTPPDRVGDVRDLLNSRYGSQYDIASGSNNSWTLTMKPAVVQSTEQHALETSIDTIRARVDSLGVTEPTIQEYNLGTNQILVELPGIEDLSRVREVIQSTARLEVHLVVSGPFPTEQAAMQSVNGVLPPENVVMEYGGNEADLQGQYYILQRVPVVAGNDFLDAQPSVDENGRPDAIFTLSNNAGDRFYRFTSSNIGKALAVVLDNRVQEAATIQQAIRDQGRITGLGKDKAENLSLMLRTGALPASIHYLQESVVGPSLGADSIREGVMASIIGMAAVLIFMLIYYHGAGINADLALILNLIILLGFMGFSGAVLTLPGIAGVILTIGMGVDSNVLIFERIREELRAGKAPGAAVEQGFAHAWTTILDTHVTTIVSALILFLFGTGPVRGFATTLSVGLCANLFTAVFVSRVIFDSILARKQRGEALSIG